jgi:hypothetical protein
MNGRANRCGDRREDAGDLSIIVVELERRCKYIEMEMKDNNKSIVVDKLLLGTGSPFIKQVANYQLPKKFKAPQILSYAGDEDPLDHLEKFRARLNIRDTQ